MGRVLIATCAEEGGLYSPAKDDRAPIRIYSDRWLEDDIAARFTGKVKRARLSRKDARLVRKFAAINRAEGRV